MVAGNTRRTVQSGKTLLDVVGAIHDLDGARIVDIAAELDVSKSTAHRHVTTLEEEEFVVITDGRVDLSSKFLRLGNYVRNREKIFTEAKPIVEELADQTGERANIYIEEHGKVICLYRAIGDRGVVAKTKAGRSFPMHATAAGKAILAGLPQERVRDIIDRRGLPACTDETITDVDELYDELEAVRRTGLSFNDEEHVRKLRSVGVPVHDADDDVIGALTVSGPSNRLVSERYQEEIPSELRGAANELELKIIYPSEE